MLANAVEERLQGRADVMLVSASVVQRVIKVQRGVSGLVPHARCYAIRSEELLALRDQVELEPAPRAARAWTLLVSAGPDPTAVESSDGSQSWMAWQPVLSAAFHALVHAELQARQLDQGALRERIRRLGSAEFQEIRAVLARDEALLPPADEREVYIEFCATYLELREFSPALLPVTFPGLADNERIERVLATDVDVDALLVRLAHGLALPRAQPSAGPGTPASVTTAGARRLLRTAERASARGDEVRAARSAARARACDDRALRARAQAIYERSLNALSERLAAALGGEQACAVDWAARWRETLALLLSHPLNSAQERVLSSLQRACDAYARPAVIVDVAGWLHSRGRRPVVRPRDCTRELEAARAFAAAARRAGALDLGLERAPVRAALEDAARVAETNARAALYPRISGVLERVGFAPDSGPEQQARAQLIAELLDQLLERGFSSLPELRDAVSRNQLKLSDVPPGDALLAGDALLRADLELERALDGVYRRGDIYLRVLQRASSLAFGNRIGRALSMYLALPAIGAFMAIEGLRHLLNPLLAWLGVAPLPAAGWPTFALSGACMFALIHSEWARVFALRLLSQLGVALAWLLFRLPRAILRQPRVQRFLARPAVRAFVRRGLVPTAFAALAYAAPPIGSETWLPYATELRAATALAVFALASAAMASRIGVWLENLLLDHLAPTWQALSRHWIPELLRLIGYGFARAMVGFERAIRSIDNALRFQRTSARAWLWAAGALGLVWGSAAFVIRLYVTLLIEPELNPLKHFPVVTVSHKLILPFLPDLLRSLEQVLDVLGPIVGGTLAGVTVFLLPSVFGFLAWELKENYRLYRATRTSFVPEARLGPEGETMHALLIPGLHGGTLPKIYDRLRHAAQRAQELQQKRGQAIPPSPAAPELARLAQRLERARTALQRFAERELVAPLAHMDVFREGELGVTRVTLSSNRIRIELACKSVPDAPCELTFEQFAGWLVAGISRLGCFATLEGDRRLQLENTLAVFYHRAGVALVREQLAAALGESPYELVEEGVLVPAGAPDQPAHLYDLGGYRPGMVAPKPVGARRKRMRWRGAAKVDLPPLDSRRVLYSQQRIAWRDWEAVWAAIGRAPAERLLHGLRILPPATRGED